MVLIPEKTVHSLSADDDTYCMFLSFWNDDKWQTKKNIMVFKNFPAVNAFERILEYYYNNYTYKKELIAACLHELASSDGLKKKPLINITRLPSKSMEFTGLFTQ